MIKRAYDELNRFYWTPQELARYEREAKNEMDFIAIRDQNIAEGEAIGMVKGEALGIMKGEEQATYRIAKSMLERGIEVDIVMESTGLKRDDVDKIKETL